jgi:hypothetical protein
VELVITGGGCQTTYDEHFDNPGGNHVTITGACSPYSPIFAPDWHATSG